MSVGLKGLFTPPAPETRDIGYLEVVHNGITYDWQIYIPQGTDIAAFLVEKEASIYADIDAKEAQWLALNPKTKVVNDPLTGEETIVEIGKNEIVKPDTPDYYAKRRAEYPSLGDQLDAMWKGTNSQAYADMMNKIQSVKIKYPK